MVEQIDGSRNIKISLPILEDHVPLVPSPKRRRKRWRFKTAVSPFVGREREKESEREKARWTDRNRGEMERDTGRRE